MLLQHTVFQMTIDAISGKSIVEPKVAVTRFLSDMATAAKRTFPAWHETLTVGIEECALSFDEKRSVIEVHPLDDYYFAGVVALETSKIRKMFQDDQARELLSLIGEHVDAVAGRKDRTISDLVFFIISRVDLAITTNSQKMPYDQVVKTILVRLGIDKVEATEHLMSDALYRHTLGEPLALGIPHWWATFKSKYSLGNPAAEATDDPTNLQSIANTKPTKSVRRKVPRRAAAF